MAMTSGQLIIVGEPARERVSDGERYVYEANERERAREWERVRENELARERCSENAMEGQWEREHRGERESELARERYSEQVSNGADRRWISNGGGSEPEIREAIDFISRIMSSTDLITSASGILLQLHFGLDMRLPMILSRITPLKTPHNKYT